MRRVGPYTSISESVAVHEKHWRHPGHHLARQDMHCDDNQCSYVCFCACWMLLVCWQMSEPSHHSNAFGIVFAPRIERIVSAQGLGMFLRLTEGVSAPRTRRVSFCVHEGQGILLILYRMPLLLVFNHFRVREGLKMLSISAGDIWS